MIKSLIKNNNLTLQELSSKQLVLCKVFLERSKEYYYHNEMRRLEKIEKEAIIRDLQEFKKAKEMRYKLRTSSPDNWFSSWHVYRSIINELSKRDVLTPEVN